MVSFLVDVVWLCLFFVYDYYLDYTWADFTNIYDDNTHTKL